jgi:hypothetical protein
MCWGILIALPPPISGILSRPTFEAPLSRATYRNGPEPIEYNWEDDAVVGGKIYLCKIALPDRKAAPREITVTVEY